MSLGTYGSKSQASAAMREHERMFHGATGNISFKSKPDLTFKRGKKLGFSF
jgi:hypothetical protein